MWPHKWAHNDNIIADNVTGVSCIHDYCPLLKSLTSWNSFQRLTCNSCGLQWIIKFLFPKDLRVVSRVSYWWSMLNQLIISTNWNCFWFRARFAIATNSKISSVVVICVLNLNSNWNCRFSSVLSSQSRKQFINAQWCPSLELLELFNEWRIVYQSIE